MHWFRLLSIIFFSFTALSLFSYQTFEIIEAIEEFIQYYSKKS
ncbi:MAG TPA: hypothetical protein VEY68_05650 [Anoxybacillus sp.]|nr:hypothetical protein [Anoxybacillus sp.]